MVWFQEVGYQGWVPRLGPEVWVQHVGPGYLLHASKRVGVHRLGSKMCPKVRSRGFFPKMGSLVGSQDLGTKVVAAPKSYWQPYSFGSVISTPVCK